MQHDRLHSAATERGRTVHELHDGVPHVRAVTLHRLREKIRAAGHGVPDAAAALLRELPLSPPRVLQVPRRVLRCGAPVEQTRLHLVVAAHVQARQHLQRCGAF